ncbi:hypothetical protein [Phocaeicola sp.]
MKIRIAAVLSANGYLASPANDTRRQWSSPKKYALSRLRKEADLSLHKNGSLLSLLAEKRSNADVAYFAEATPDTMDLIKGLLLYRLADELFLYSLPYNMDGGVPLSDFLNLEDWELREEHALPERVVCRVYRRQAAVNV